MLPSEFVGRYALNELYSVEDARRLDAAIQDDLLDKTSIWLYEQLGFCLGGCQKWIGAMYAAHFKEILLNEGEYAGYEGENYIDTPLLSFQGFLDYLRVQIDYAEDYDKARAKHSK